MPTLVQIQLGPPPRLCSSVVERTLGKGEVTSSILVRGSFDQLIEIFEPLLSTPIQSL